MANAIASRYVENDDPPTNVSSDPDEQPAQRRAGNVADPAEHRRHERLDTR